MSLLQPKECEQKIISVNPTIQSNYEQYEKILNRTENKMYDDNGDLVCGNPYEEFYEGEDICKPVDLDKA